MWTKIVALSLSLSASVAQWLPPICTTTGFNAKHEDQHEHEESRINTSTSFEA